MSSNGPEGINTAMIFMTHYTSVYSERIWIVVLFCSLSSTVIALFILTGRVMPFENFTAGLLMGPSNDYSVIDWDCRWTFEIWLHVEIL